MKQFFNIAIFAIFSIFVSCSSIDEPQFIDNPTNPEDYETFTMDIKVDSTNLLNTRAVEHKFYDDDYYKSLIDDIDFTQDSFNTTPTIIAVKGEDVYSQAISSYFKINEIGLSLKKKEKDKITLSVTYLKANPPSDLKIYCVYGSYFSYSQSSALRCYQTGPHYSESSNAFDPRFNLYYGMVDFSDVSDWENVNKQLVMKRPCSVVSILSDADDIEDVKVSNNPYYPGYYDVQKTSMISPNTQLPDFSSYRWQKKILAYTYMKYDILSQNPTITLSSWDPRTEHWFDWNDGTYGSLFNKKKLGNRTFGNFGEFMIFCSPDGELPTVDYIEYYTDKSFTEDNIPEKGKKIKYCILTLWGSDHKYNNASVYQFKIKHAVIPLPDKMYPNRIYYIKNKSGTKFFGSPYNYEYDDDTPDTKSSNSYQTDVNIISPDDIEIESYDINTMAKIED